MKQNIKFDNLDKHALKFNISAFLNEFKTLNVTSKNLYSKNNLKDNGIFKDNSSSYSIFKRGLSIADKNIYNQIFGQNNEPYPLSMDMLNLDIFLTGVIMSISDDDDLLKKISKLISDHQYEFEIMEFIKKIDEDIYKKILANIPNAKKINIISDNLMEDKRKNFMKNNNDDEENEDSENPFFGDEHENFEHLHHQYEFKAEALMILYEELKKRNFPSKIINELIIKESKKIDTLIGR
jgi:hypothetical protein